MQCVLPTEPKITSIANGTRNSEGFFYLFQPVGDRVSFSEISADFLIDTRDLEETEKKEDQKEIRIYSLNFGNFILKMI